VREGTELRVITVRDALYENLELSSMKSEPLISDRSRKCNLICCSKGFKFEGAVRKIKNKLASLVSKKNNLNKQEVQKGKNKLLIENRFQVIFIIEAFRLRIYLYDFYYKYF